MKSPSWKPLLLGVLVGAAGLVASPLQFTLDREEDLGLGLLFRLRGPVPPPRDAVVVSIDRESSERLHVPDNPDKWPRSLHARLTETLAREGAAAVSFDVHFIEPRVPGDDERFARALEGARNVLLTEPIRTSDILTDGGDSSPGAGGHSVVRVVPPIPLLADAAAATAPFTLPRIPFKVSRFFTFDPGAGDAPSVPTVILHLYAGGAWGDFVRLLERASPSHAGKFPRDLVQAGDGPLRSVMKGIRSLFVAEPTIPDRMRADLAGAKEFAAEPERARRIAALIRVYEGPNNRFLNYYGPPRTVPTIPYHEALRIRDGAVDDRKVDLRGKAVFVGLSEALLAERKDSFYTVFSRANGTFIGGVEISATAYLNVLEDRAVKPLGLLPHVLVVLLWGTAAGFVCRRFHVAVAGAAVAAMGALYLGAAWYRFSAASAWHPLVVPLFLQLPLAFVGGVVWNYVDTRKEKEKIRKAFEQYLPKNVVDQLLENLGEAGRAAESLHGVCLFTDAEHYTTLSEALSPRELAAFMNRYYEALFRPVKKHGGVVSNLAGDSMLAIWVSATPDPALKERACLAAIEIQEETDRLYRPSDLLQLKTRIGLHYGEVFLGNIGTSDRYQHSVMGDIVNTASRIEGLNKHLGTKILASDEAMGRVGGRPTRELGTFRLKGKIQPIVIHELPGGVHVPEGRLAEAYRLFAEGLEAYREMRWSEAAARFRGTAEILDGDEPSRFYISLCERYRTDPPWETWDGVIQMDRK